MNKLLIYDGKLWYVWENGFNLKTINTILIRLFELYNVEISFINYHSLKITSFTIE